MSDTVGSACQGLSLALACMSDNSDNSETDYASSDFEGHGEGVCFICGFIML